MRILILGATGFVGSAIATLLTQANYDISCGARDINTLKNRFPKANIIYCNFEKDTDIQTWIPRLQGIDILINCVGIFYHYKKDILWKLHYETPKALFAAAEQCHVKKIIHLSALGIERYDTDYARSKIAAEKQLALLKIAHVIIKPSFIYGANARGGMALIRGLAALPLIPLPGHGKQQFQPISIEDLTQAIKRFVDTDCKDNITLAAVSPEKITLKNMIGILRQWLGLKKTLFIYIPSFFIRLVAWLGNFFAYSTVQTAAITMLKQGNTATEKETRLFQEKVGFKIKGFQEGINNQPGKIQDYWYARLFFMRPLLRLSLAFMWLFTAFTSAILYPPASSYLLLKDVGIPTFWHPFFLYSASLLDAVIGIALLVNYKAKIIYIIQIIIIFIYTLIISVKLPYFWLDPFGPIVKNIPILVAILMLYMIEPADN
ncbi:SDR family oxidoreductase [Legionella cardiaca]|uniref:SDR family oxidoreductase n=1 Tax=Legionella cardiaca TaxID=1071983 RepID=A0ABY8AW98_9GAMM|nr:SDR family oxidoreductase [Legionella cardiaca]WED43996.1 SDR family oxidoreductase [Legionella cardiaca]